jgi:hypothetical protein
VEIPGSFTIRAGAWLESPRGACFFLVGCFLAREASDWWSEYVFLRSFGMRTVSHRPDTIAILVDFRHHYLKTTFGAWPSFRAKAGATDPAVIPAAGKAGPAP